jgi:hypothetical protein
MRQRLAVGGGPGDIGPRLKMAGPVKTLRFTLAPIRRFSDFALTFVGASLDAALITGGSKRATWAGSLLPDDRERVEKGLPIAVQDDSGPASFPGRQAAKPNLLIKERFAEWSVSHSVSKGRCAVTIAAQSLPFLHFKPSRKLANEGERADVSREKKGWLIP